ncbi:MULTISPECIES: septum formation initiator family protein [unclassified Exiguobacterium]|uniref:FtsB family cell division protein n=1 Tax=unclassified Exiguobacterium TaxID=2644629 RepID=UPI0008C1A0F4|nr:MULTISPECIES: septum formation initiator family protein [unclassified Exiguobacterium]OGX79222.1 septum formation initiator [Exiguobacterium sp. SH31]TCI33131.1 septum formation initiator family protein [Exiguobacterium sp. SH4S7]TCI42305.1 septum formation initiator family protein [Exiguobacterium sp. SH5S32]TCI49542.1 septum formation initiator family protein [Exiguobacterium sp. SH1S4]TCI58734.1 septum formation initiator family protein [Exiguobacterium sp. SH0S2]
MNGRNPMERKQRIRALDERREQLEKEQSRRRIHLRRRLAVASLVFLLLIVFIGQSYFSKIGYVADQELKQDEARVELRETKEEQAELKEQVERLQDEEYIANLARNELLFSKDGEIIFYFSPEE